MTGPRRPDALWFRLAVIVALLLSAAWGLFYYFAQTGSRSFAALPEAMREELAELPVPAEASAGIEREWAKEGFGNMEYLTAPVGPLPCDAAAGALSPRDQTAAREAIALRDQGDADTRIERLAAIADGAPGNLLVALVFGTELINAGRSAEADRVIAQTLERTQDDDRTIAASRDPRTRLDLGDEGVSTVIHLHHALGVARLAQSGAMPPWISLKNVIGSVKPLSARRLIGTSRGAPSWSKLLIAAPGCATTTPGTLSSYDLYNNLIAGYMRARRFEGDEPSREREFSRRTRTNPSALHELLLGQVARARANGWQHEAELWALSNVEQLLDERVPDDARLNLNAIRVIDWWLEGNRCEPAICTAELRARLAKTKDELLEQAFLRRNVTPDQQRAFAQAVTRLLAGSNVPRARIASGVAVVKQWLPASQASTLGDLSAADEARNALPRSITGMAAADAEPPETRLGARGKDWRKAAERDFAAAAAKWAATRSPGEQRAVIIASRQLLAGAEAPKALVDLEQQRADLSRIRLAASKWWWALIAFLLAALTAWILLWLIVVVRDARALRTSFYNAELEYLRGAEPPPGRDRH